MEKIKNNQERRMATKRALKRKARTNYKSRSAYLKASATSVKGRTGNLRKELNIIEKPEQITSADDDIKKKPAVSTRNISYAWETPANQSWFKFRKKMRSKGFDF